MKKVANRDGIAGWKIDSPVERALSKWADHSKLGKTLYVTFYKVFDREYFIKGLKFIDRNIQNFVGEVTPAQRKNYIYDMVYSLHRFGCMFDEYFLYDYPKLNTQGRESFITDKIRWDYYARMNLDENKELFNNKRKAYELFRPYYKRDLIEITGPTDWDSFSAFAQKHSRFIVKPIAGSGGNGIYIEDLTKHASSEAVFATLLEKAPVVVEALICQCAEMASLHPASLNTVRIPTLKLKDRVIVFRPFLRTGMGDSVVDNAAHGGVFVAVDGATGICISKGVDEFGHQYIRHPDTGVVLPGFQIPRWEEAVATVTRLAHVIETNNYVGWDMALTDEGWVMVEGNPRGQFVIQIATKEGIKDELEAYINQM